jgi:hypothetical protein
VRGPTLRGRRLGPLAEAVQEREDEDAEQHDEEAAPKPGVVPQADEVAVPLEDDVVRVRSHRAPFRRCSAVLLHVASTA